MDVLKAVEDYPENPEVGDVVSKISVIYVGDSWNFDDETTARLHFDENNLDTGETYTIAEFTAYLNGQLGTYQVKYEYGDFNSAGQNNWYLRVIYPDNLTIDNYKLDGLSQQDGYYMSPKAEDSSQTIYIDVRYAQDDFSGSGWMIQIGVADGQYGWGGTYEDITDLETYDIEIPSGTYKADGSYVYDEVNDEWIPSNWKEINEVAEVAAGALNEVRIDIDSLYNETVHIADGFGNGYIRTIEKIQQSQYDNLVANDETSPETLYVVIPDQE